MKYVKTVRTVVNKQTGTNYILLVQFGVYFPILRMHAFNIWSITNTRGAPFPFDDILKLALFNQRHHGVQVLKTPFYPIFRRLLLLKKNFCGLHWQAIPEPF